MHAPQARIAIFLMKTYRNLFPQVYDFENLYGAYRAARRGKRDRREVARFEARVEDQLFQLQDELRSETYCPGAYRHFYISEPKRRKISAAPFRDRVVHHALVNVLEPIFERRFIFDSYADDFLLFHDDKATLHGWMNELHDFAASRLRLVLHPTKCQVFPTATGVPFLGFRHFATHRRLKRPAVVRFRRRLRALQRSYARRQISLDKAVETAYNRGGAGRQRAARRLVG